MNKRILAAIASFGLLLIPALADPALVDAGLTLGDHVISYPQVVGMDDEDLQEQINHAIVEAGAIDVLLAKLPLYLSGDTVLKVGWTGAITGDILSVSMLASGPVGEGDRLSQVWSSFNCHLSDGTVISLSDWFDSEIDGLGMVEEYLEYDLAPELSAHLENQQLTPVPECYAVSPVGLTFCYPIDQLSTLTGKAGAVSLLWHELQDGLDLQESGLAVQAGAGSFLSMTEKDILGSVCADGKLPGIPCALGDSVQALVNEYGQLTDPDLCEAGRLLYLEGAAWRGTAVITDALSVKSWENSVVNGLRSDRISLYGLITGITGQQEWRQLLGEPESSVHVDEAQADLWRIVPGTSDYYSFGGHRLRLHADEEGILATIFLME